MGSGGCNKTMTTSQWSCFVHCVVHLGAVCGHLLHVTSSWPKQGYHVHKFRLFCCPWNCHGEQQCNLSCCFQRIVVDVAQLRQPYRPNWPRPSRNPWDSRHRTNSLEYSTPNRGKVCRASWAAHCQRRMLPVHMLSSVAVVVMLFL